MRGGQANNCWAKKEAFRAQQWVVDLQNKASVYKHADKQTSSFCCGFSSTLCLPHKPLPRQQISWEHWEHQWKGDSQKGQRGSSHAGSQRCLHLCVNADPVCHCSAAITIPWKRSSVGEAFLHELLQYLQLLTECLSAVCAASFAFIVYFSCTRSSPCR